MRRRRVDTIVLAALLAYAVAVLAWRLLPDQRPAPRPNRPGMTPAEVEAYTVEPYR